ncbi:MAG TPA: GNAT family N-acetyltransferase [Acidimicrobiales bacterium]|nr:GNAT family N-acetyltransferase [Acidimicrobiales bacterium]
MSTTGPPERLDAGDGIVLRREQEADAEAIAAAVGESLDHLRPWMPWAQPSEARAEAQRERIAASRQAWDEGSIFTYAVTRQGVAGVVGVFGLHRRLGPGAIEMGYWVHPRHVNQGVATAAARVLTEAALGLADVDRVEIHCDEANLASQAVPRKLGYRLDRIEDDEVTAPAETGRSMIWVRQAGRADQAGEAGRPGW